MVYFEKSERIHTLDIDGNIISSSKIQVDEMAGDITKGGEGKGTSAEPYRINCIEDLVAFSEKINNKEIPLNCYVILMRTLDFKSVLSYGNIKKTYIFDEEKNAYITNDDSETTLMELCTTGQGFIPIGISGNRFAGNFNGQLNEIQNIYINREDYAGLFGMTSTCTIEDIGVTGNITSTNSCAAGIVATEWNSATTTIRRCHNKANVTAQGNAGGIFAGSSQNGIEWTYIYESYNAGTIISTGGLNVGGIAASGYANFDMCYNTGDIIQKTGVSTSSTLGGIGGSYPVAKNCYNTGYISTEKDYSAAGGISGCWSGTKGNIYNCYNLGTIEGNGSWYVRQVGGIGALTADNCYNLGIIIGTGKREISKNTRDRCYYSSNIGNTDMIDIADLTDISSKTLEEFVELLNSYREEKEDGEGNMIQVWPEGWKRWKAGENGYPVFE